MGYSSERGAAARNLLRARAHGHEDAIEDAEVLAHAWLGSDDDGDEVEEYIASRYADFVPEAPVITDDMVERAGFALFRRTFGKTRTTENARRMWDSNEVAGGVRESYRRRARTALEAALTPKENEA